MDQALLDDIINRLLEVRGRPGKQVQLSESEIRQLCAASREIFLQQPNLLELEAPIKICGNLFLLPFQLAIVAIVALCFFFNPCITLPRPRRFVFGRRNNRTRTRHLAWSTVRVLFLRFCYDPSASGLF